ncbi:MAG: sensor histidine kinase, partial [Gammaproteobacteria bacterium]
RFWFGHVGRCPWYVYIYLLYLAFLFIQPIAAHAGWQVWAITIASIVVFLPLYFVAWSNRKGRTPLWATLGILALGYALFPINGGAGAYVIYGVALFGFVLMPRPALLAITACLALMAAEGWLLHVPLAYWAYILTIAAIIGGANVSAGSQSRSNAKLRRAQEEIEHLAKVAERERIARDMHDVLGHTLSVIILKSELASKLIPQRPDRARTEISEVEQIAREALAEVRHAIRGYRSGSLAEEFAHARSTLETAGIHVECGAREISPGAVKLSPAQETVLALVTREAVTNIVRHSDAKNCRIDFEQNGGSYRIVIEDDGRGGTLVEGNGLRGIRERVEALEGTIIRDGSQGTRLTVSIPERRKQEAIA